MVKLFWSFRIVFVVFGFRFGCLACFGGFVSLVSVVSFRSFRFVVSGFSSCPNFDSLFGSEIITKKLHYGLRKLAGHCSPLQRTRSAAEGELDWLSAQSGFLCHQ